MFYYLENPSSIVFQQHQCFENLMTSSLGTLGIWCKQQWETLGGFVKEVWGKGLKEVKNQESEMIHAHCQKGYANSFSCQKKFVCMHAFINKLANKLNHIKKNLKTFESQSWTHFSCIQITSCALPKMIHNNCMQIEWFFAWHDFGEQIGQ